MVYNAGEQAAVSGKSEERRPGVEEVCDDVEVDVHHAPIESDIEKQNSSTGAPNPPAQGASPNDPVIARTRSNVSNALGRVATRLSRSLTNPGPPPDGGMRAWLQVCCAWLVIMNTWGFVNAFGAFQTYYGSILPQSPSTISWIGSVQACLMFFLGTFAGRALDAGLFLPTVVTGIFFQLLGIFTMSAAKNYWQLLLTQGVLTGIGGGIIFCPSMGLMATYFAKRRGIAVGLSTTGNSVGGLVYPLVVRQLLPKVGFGWTVRVLGFINVVSLSVLVVLMKPRLPPRKSGPLVEWRAIQDIPYVLFVIGICFMMASTYFSFYYIASYARDVIGMPYTQSVNLVIVLNGVGLPARIAPGFIADLALGVLNTQLIFMVMSAILLFGWLGVSSSASFYVFTVLYGISVAAWQSLFPTAVTSLGDDITKTGTRLGMAFSVISFAALTGGPIGGAILQANDGSYAGPIAWAATSATIGVCCIVSARVSKYGWKLKVKC